MEAEAYADMAAAETRHWWFRGRRRVLDSVIRRLGLPAQARILELGSGTGGNFEMLSRFGAVTAVEMNEVARAMSLRKTEAVRDVRAGFLPDDLPLGAELYDLVCLFDVLEHVEADEATLRAVRRHLVPGGAAVITVPAFRWLWGPHDKTLHHKRRYERRELRDKILAAGFTIDKLSYANMLLFPAAVAARIADKALRRPQSSGDALPPGTLNEIFAGIFGFESHLLGWTNLPVGLSLLAVVRANGPAAEPQQAACVEQAMNDAGV
jgi:SAM-dependent methyltransferase